MKDKIIVEFVKTKTGESMDIEIPVTITANELIYALNKALHLGISMEDVSQGYLITENPIVLLKGDLLLEEYGLHDGTRIYFNR